jgi:RNA polymerase sigma factor (sigma-70 family)
MALLSAVKNFDCSLGWRFSTYACKAILSSFSRLAKNYNTYVSRFPIQLDTEMLHDNGLKERRKMQYDDMLDDLRDFMRDDRADLTRIERSVIEMRFFIRNDNRKSMTLKHVGETLGLTKERIRQIQNGALSKLRSSAKSLLNSA